MSDKGTSKLGRSGPGSLVMDLEVFDQEENVWTKTHFDEDELSSNSTVPMTDSEDEQHEVEEEESGGDEKAQKELEEESEEESEEEPRMTVLRSVLTDLIAEQGLRRLEAKVFEKVVEKVNIPKIREMLFSRFKRIIDQWDFESEFTQEIGLVGLEAKQKFVRGDVVSSAFDGLERIHHGVGRLGKGESSRHRQSDQQEHG